MIAGLILAAGFSSRMGSPKALLEFQGETFLDRLIATLGECCETVVAVLGHEAEKIKAGLQRQDAAVFVTNPDYPLGQLSSLQCGLRVLLPTAHCPPPTAVMFMPVDYPNVRPATVRELAACFNTFQPAVCVPEYRGKHGHPVCFSSALIPEFLDLPPESQAREAIHRHKDRTRYIDVADPGILDDIDDRESYARLLGQGESE